MDASVRFEHLLREHWGATGNGFAALVSSVRHKLRDDLWKGLKHFAKLRNNAAHKMKFAVPPDLGEQCEFIRQGLVGGPDGRTRFLYGASPSRSRSAAKLALWQKITLFFQQHPGAKEEPLDFPEGPHTDREELTDCLEENLDDYG